MGSLTASSYVFDSLILLLNFVINIVYSYNVQAASDIDSAKLSSVIVGVIAIGAVTIKSTVAAISIIFVHTFFGLLLGLGSLGGIFLFNNWDFTGHWLSRFALYSNSSMNGLLTIMTCLV